MRAIAIAAVVLALAQSAPVVAAEPAVAEAPFDVETTLNGVPVACTGIGADVRAEPRWTSYGVRVEFSNARNEYLGGGAVTVRTSSGQVLLNAHCDAPWLLMRLPPGEYLIEGRADEPAKPRSARVAPPRTGQIRVVLQFPEL